jgi:hypothetical protein
VLGINDDIPNSCPPPLKYEPQEYLTVGFCGGYDRCRQFVPARISACLVRHVNKLVKTAICRQGPAEAGLFRHGGASPESCLKVYTSVFILQVLWSPACLVLTN